MAKEADANNELKLQDSANFGKVFYVCFIIPTCQLFVDTL
jgi:hypothetical protein